MGSLETQEEPFIFESCVYDSLLAKYKTIIVVITAALFYIGNIYQNVSELFTPFLSQFSLVP